MEVFKDGKLPCQGLWIRQHQRTNVNMGRRSGQTESAFAEVLSCGEPGIIDGVCFCLNSLILHMRTGSRQ